MHIAAVYIAASLPVKLMRVAAAVLDVGGVLRAGQWTLLFFLSLRAYILQSLTPAFKHERPVMSMRSDVVPGLTDIRRRQERVALRRVRNTRDSGAHAATYEK